MNHVHSVGLTFSITDLSLDFYIGAHGAPYEQ